MGRRGQPSEGRLLDLLDDRRRDEDEQFTPILAFVGRLEQPPENRNLAEPRHELAVDRFFVGVHPADDGRVAVSHHDGGLGFLDLNGRQVVDRRAEVRSLPGCRGRSCRLR